MKNIILLNFVLLLSPSTIFAQEFTDRSDNWPWDVGLEYGHGMMNSQDYNQYSLIVGHRLAKNFGLTWNIDYIHQNDGSTQVHIPGGPIIGAVIGLFAQITRNGREDNGRSLLFLLMLIPDGISGHFKIGQSFEISPYANLLGFDITKAYDSDLTYMYFGTSFGTKLTFYNQKRFIASTFFETRKNEIIDWTYGGGVSVGFTFGN